MSLMQLEEDNALLKSTVISLQEEVSSVHTVNGCFVNCECIKKKSVFIYTSYH